MTAPLTQDNCTLLPCPFCGGEASLGTVSYTEKTVAEQQWEQDTFHKVNCIICGTDNCGLVGHKTAEKAAAAWNKRATPPADMEGARKQVIEGLAAAIRDPECPVQFSPLLMEARKMLADTALQRAPVDDLLAALINVRSIIADGAMTGFNCHEGDWADRLFASQAMTSDAIKKATLIADDRSGK